MVCKVIVFTRISHNLADIGGDCEGAKKTGARGDLVSLSSDPAIRASPSGTYHINEADGGLYIVGLGDYNL